jgi:hypothetical protein
LVPDPKLVILLVSISGKEVRPGHSFQVATRDVAPGIEIMGKEVRLVQNSHALVKPEVKSKFHPAGKLVILP